VCTSPVGDLDSLITPDIGTLVGGHSEAAYRAATAHSIQLLSQSDTAERCRAVAGRELSLTRVGIPRYREMYEQVAERVAERLSTSRAR
jgi:hypothetical protein